MILPVSGAKIVGGVFRGNAALNGIAIAMEVILTAQTNLRRGERIALRNQNLGPHQVDAGDHLCDSVLHLNPGIHLDKVVIPLLIHQKLHRAGIDITDALGNLDCVLV